MTAMDKALEVTSKREAISQRDRIIKNLQWSGKLTDKEKAVLYHACKAYGLDPALREIVVLGGNMYVTKDGMIRIAERSNCYAGLKLEEMKPLEDNEKRYKCTVKKIVQGIVCEFEGIGRASVKNVRTAQISDFWLDEMAQKRAIARALRVAFPIAIPSIDEIVDDSIEATIVTPLMLEGVKDEVETEEKASDE